MKIPMKAVIKLFLVTVLFVIGGQVSADVFNGQIFDDKKEDPRLLGHWYNEMGGAEVGLMLKTGGECELYVSRFPNPERRSRCKFESGQGRFFLYIYKENGECGEDASFEFWYRPELAQVALLSGGSEILMQKK